MSDFKGKDYLSTLDDSSRDLYMNKLQLADNSQLPNQYDLLGWKNDVSSLPDISWRDTLIFFYKHTSETTLR